MLSFAENIVLLAMDGFTGHLRPLPERALDYALAGALLMGLVTHKRLDPGLESIKILDGSPTGDILLDEALSRLANASAHTLVESIRMLAGHSHHVLEAVIKRLEKKEIFGHEESRFLGLLIDEQHPILDHTEERVVLKRIRAIVLENQKASPDDLGIIALIHACDLEPVLFSPNELETHANAIAALAEQDPIGKPILNAIRHVQHSLHQMTEHAGL